MRLNYNMCGSSKEGPAAVPYIGESARLHKEEVLVYGCGARERVGCLLQSTSVSEHHYTTTNCNVCGE